jgi:MFS family permease
MWHRSPMTVYSAQVLIGGSGAFLAPTVAAITLGIVGAGAFDKQFGKNQAFNSAGNVFTALLVAYVSYKFGYRAIFVIAALLAIPAAASLFGVDAKRIDYARARGSIKDHDRAEAEGLSSLLKDRVLLSFLATAFLFHLANAAMLPQLGEMLSKGSPKAAAPFMSACIIVTQLVIAVTAAWIGRRAAAKGRKSLLLLGFGVLPIRGVLYTLTHAAGALIAIQTLDGVANAIFGIVSILVIKDRTQGTGRFNIAAGSLATMVGMGAAVSTTLGGVLIQHLGYRASFLGLAGIALLAFTLLCFAVPETRPDTAASSAADKRADINFPPAVQCP